MGLNAADRVRHEWRAALPHFAPIHKNFFHNNNNSSRFSEGNWELGLVLLPSWELLEA